MNSLTFLERVAILTGVLVLITVLLVSALAVVGYVGLSMTPPAELALGLLIAVSFLAAVGLGIALGAGIVAFGLLAVGLMHELNHIQSHLESELELAPPAEGPISVKEGGNSLLPEAKQRTIADRRDKMESRLKFKEE